MVWMERNQKWWKRTREPSAESSTSSCRLENKKFDEKGAKSNSTSIYMSHLFNCDKYKVIHTFSAGNLSFCLHFHSFVYYSFARARDSTFSHSIFFGFYSFFRLLCCTSCVTLLPLSQMHKCLFYCCRRVRCEWVFFKNADADNGVPSFGWNASNANVVLCIPLNKKKYNFPFGLVCVDSAKMFITHCRNLLCARILFRFPLWKCTEKRRIKMNLKFLPFNQRITWVAVGMEKKKMSECSQAVGKIDRNGDNDGQPNQWDIEWVQSEKENEKTQQTKAAYATQAYEHDWLHSRDRRKTENTASGDKTKDGTRDKNVHKSKCLNIVRRAMSYRIWWKRQRRRWWRRRQSEGLLWCARVRAA